MKLQDCAVIEQAKGALAQARSLEMCAAFEGLLALADAEGVTLGVAARLMHETWTRGLGRR